MIGGVPFSGMTLIVKYENKGKLFYSLLIIIFNGRSNNGPFGEQTGLDHLNAELVRYSDPHCISFFSLDFLNLF